MSNRYVKFSVILFVAAIVIAAFHYLVYIKLPVEAQTPQIFPGEIFIFLLTWLTMMVVSFLIDKSPKNVGFAFIGASMLKMIITTVYLLPDILNKTDSTKSFIFQFFAVYFSFLTVEAVLTFRALNKMA